MKKPNPVQTVLSVASCKLTRLILRKTGRGGTAIPGIVAMKVSKNILAAVSSGMEIVVVTGTNGKTTTCNMIEHALSHAGRKVLLDRSGANMLNGIASDLICNSDWRGRPRYNCAVLECDEAALKNLVPFIRPKVIVVTNLFSDQVDRYGSVGNTLEEIRKGVKRSPESTLVLNAEDPLSSSLALHVPNKVLRYGMSKAVGEQGVVDLSDAGVCPECGSSYEYDYHIYAHLGGFRCPKCGCRRQEPDFEVISIDEKDSRGSTIKLQADGAVREVRVGLPAVYNIYNAAAAAAAAAAMGVPIEKALESLSGVHSSFGRLETFDLGGLHTQMILVKNPAGCNQAFSYVTGCGQDYTAVLCLNDRTGDGHDISWIESTDYEKLCADPHLKKIYVGGERADDLYERLVKAGGEASDNAGKTSENAGEKRMEKITDYPALIEQLKKDGLPVYFLPNYTAMMDLRPLLMKETGTKDFWE